MWNKHILCKTLIQWVQNIQIGCKMVSCVNQLFQLWQCMGSWVSLVVGCVLTLVGQACVILLCVSIQATSPYTVPVTLCHNGLWSLQQYPDGSFWRLGSGMDCKWSGCVQTQPSAVLWGGKSASPSPLHLVIKEGETTCPWTVGSFYQATDLDVHWAYWLKEGDTSRGMTAYWKEDTIFIQPGGCRHPFDVVSTVIHEIGHQMRQRSKHCCEDHHCIVWQNCSQQAGALLNRKISCTPHSQLTPIMRELAFHYGDNWLANVHIGIYSCANVCCRDAPVDILPCLVKQIELDWETEVSK